MRIFYASDSTPNSALKSNIWRNNLLLPLVDLGHDVIEFQYDFRETFSKLDTRNPEHQAFIGRNRPKITAEIMRQFGLAHSQHPVDLFFSYFYDACIDPSALDKIKAMGVTTVNWYCNGSYQLHLVTEISPHYNWCLVPEKFRLDDYRRMGAHPIYCQEAANPDVYKPYNALQEFEVAFVGQAYGERPDYIKYLHNSGVNVRAWGPGWRPSHDVTVPPDAPLWKRAGRFGKRLLREHGPSVIAKRFGAPVMDAGRLHPAFQSLPPGALPEQIVGEPLTDDEMVRMYSRAKINLGFSTCGDTHLAADRILQVRLRDFEIPMSGGFYMVEYMEELEEFYEIGKEIVCYRSPDDLLEKIRYYLAHDSEREAIRLAGYDRCRRDHTWQKRFQNSFARMGLT